MTSRPRQSALVLGLAAALVVGAWLVFGRGGSTAKDGGVGPGPGRVRGQPGLRDAASGSDASGRRVGDRTPTLPPSRVGGEAAPARLTVRVVDEDDRPVAGAQVGAYVIRRNAEPASWAEREERAFSGAQEANARGEVRIPAREEVRAWNLFARHEGGFARVWVPWGKRKEVQVLRLRRDLTIHVRVLDGADRPVAGAPVQLADESALERGSAAWLKTSGRDGIATFRHAQTRIQPRWGEDGIVLLRCPTPRPVFERLLFASLPPEPIVLRMPQTGAIRVTLVDAQLQPVRDLHESVYAELRLSPRVAGAEDRQRRQGVRFEGTTLDLPWVGLGLRLHLQLDSAELSGAVEFDGPRAVGERVEQRIVVERHATLSGRLVDGDGVPQKGHWWATHVRPGGGYYNQYFETSEDGLFHTPIPKLPGKEAAPRGLWFRRTLRGDEKQCWYDLTKLALHGGRNELGDVVLRPPPVLVTGRVVDDAGQPVAGAVLQVFHGDPEGAVQLLAAFRRSRHRSAADGTFRVRAHALADELLLRASKDGSTGGLVAFRKGGPPVSYVLPRVGAVTMDVRFENGLTKDQVLFYRRNQATGVTTVQAARFVLSGDTIRWRGVRPGRWDFGVRLLGSPRPLVAVKGIEVIAAQTRRLPEQRLGAGLRELEIRIVGPAGAPVERASVVVDPDRLGKQPRAALSAELGRVVVRTAQLPVDLLVIAPGFRSRRVRGVEKATTVRLVPGLEVLLRVKLPEGALAKDQQLLPAIRRFDPADPDSQPWRTGHALYSDGATKTYYPSRHSWLWSRRSPVGGDGRLAFRVPAPGTYAIEWEITGAGERELGTSARRVFRVRESSTPTRVAVELSASDLR